MAMDEMKSIVQDDFGGVQGFFLRGFDGAQHAAGHQQAQDGWLRRTGTVARHNLPSIYDVDIHIVNIGAYYTAF